MKKLILVLLTMLIVFNLVACDSSSQQTNPDDNAIQVNEEVSPIASEPAADDTTSESKYPDASELEKFKIGFIYFSFTDVLGQQYKKAAEYFCEQFNCEPVFVETGMDLEAWVTGAQNLIESGCNAIMCSLNSVTVMKMCEEAEVLYFACNVPWDDKEWQQELENMEYSVGQIIDNDISAAKAGIEALHDAGCKNVAVISPDPGFLVHDLRFDTAIAEIENYSDMNFIAEFRGAEQGEGVTQLTALYPDIDGMMIVANDGKAMAAYYNEGLNSRGVKLACIDVAAGTEEAFISGDMVFCATGQYTTWYAELVLVYNKLLGDDLAPDKSEPIQRTMVYITSIEDFDNVAKYIDGDVPCYTGDEMKAYIKKWNPSVTPETIIQMNDEFSLEDVISRHADLVD